MVKEIKRKSATLTWKWSVKIDKDLKRGQYKQLGLFPSQITHLAGLEGIKEMMSEFSYHQKFSLPLPPAMDITTSINVADNLKVLKILTGKKGQGQSQMLSKDYVYL